jgi:tetratricopeptide (TPR) repeat protein
MQRCVLLSLILVSLILALGPSGALAQQKNDCEGSSRLKSVDTESLLSRGICHLNNGDTDLAISDFDQFIELNPNWVAGYFNRGNAHYRKRAYDRAVADYDQALQLKVQAPDAIHLNRGNAYREMGNYDRALSDYDLAIRLKPKFDEYYRIRGETYERKGELGRARGDYQNALSLNPGNRASSEGLKRLEAASARQVQLATIANPRIGESRLDWCREWARSCGKAAADEFCRREGFVEAASFAKAPRIQVPTRVIGTGQICNSVSCDGFSSITCRKAESPPPTPSKYGRYA